MANVFEQLKRDLDVKAMDDIEGNSDNFIESGELTESEEAAIQKMKEDGETEIVVSEIGPDGVPVKQSIAEFTKALDDKVVIVKTALDEDKTIKLLNSGDIKHNVDDMRNHAQAHAMSMYRDMARTERSDDEILRINDAAIAQLQSVLKTDRIDSDEINRQLAKMPLVKIVGMLPSEFVDAYVSDDEIRMNSEDAKNRLLTVISYLCITGPEMDYLNEYIDAENRLAMVSKKILQCQIDFTEMLKDEAKMSELVERSIRLAPKDDSFWSRYIKLPNRVHNEFAQRVVLQEEYKKAYQNLLNDPDVAGNADTTELVQSEIEEADAKIDVYTHLCELTLLRDVVNGLYEQYQDQKNLSAKFLLREADRAVERVRRCKQDLPFPGIKNGANNKARILPTYMSSYTKMLHKYNDTVMGVLRTEMQKEDGATTTDIIPVYIKGVDNNTVIGYFALVLLIAMGRIVKRLAGNTANKYDAIQLDGYFQLFCRLGTDIYVMTDVWSILEPIITFLVNKLETNRA